MGVVQVEQVSKKYSNHQALSKVDLDVNEQSIYGLLGPNGAGKTTMIRIINQIINADEGRIFIQGEELKPAHIEVIGYLPEERGLYKKMTVGDQLMYFGELKGLRSTEAKKRIKEWLDRFDILSWWNKKVEDLSKGMAQKIQFISTVIHEPPIIILDEPFSGFDPVNANLIKNEILRLRDEGATVIFSTHRMESVEELCDHIALINKSEKILDGPKKKIKNDHRSNKYDVEHYGPLQAAATSSVNGFELIGQEDLGENMFKSIVQIGPDRSPNDLLKSLIEKTEVHGFFEVIPSMNDIFISMVGADDNEE